MSTLRPDGAHVSFNNNYKHRVPTGLLITDQWPVATDHWPLATASCFLITPVDN